MHETRAAIYLRVSTEERREGEVRSYERQRSGSTNGINGLVEQHKLNVVHEFIEEDGVLHKWNDGRPELAIRTGDELLEINGKLHDPSAMMSQLRTEQT